jgi:hypothetical protein
MGVPLKTENEENPGGACKRRVAKAAGVASSLFSSEWDPHAPGKKQCISKSRNVNEKAILVAKEP